MSNLFSGINARLRGASSKPSSNSKSPISPTSEDGRLNSPGGLSQRSHSSSNLSSSKLPPVPASPLPTTANMSSSTDDELAAYHLPKPLPLWLNPAYAKQIVKGNFMTLSRRPKAVEQGEWIACQVVEHYRNLWNFVSIVYQKEENGQSICNPKTCPRMSAGENHSYTWLNNRFEPIELPAYEYMTLMQRWISGKVDDEKVFPTNAAGVSFSHHQQITPSAIAKDGLDEYIGKRSGFPKEFSTICKTIFLQMFRVYAHLYWAHFVEPFYHLNLEKQLNSCFSHFVLAAMEMDMLKPQELEPMQPLLDLWAANGTFPPDSKAYESANLKAGNRLLQLAGMA